MKIVDRELTAEERQHSILVTRDQAALSAVAGSCGSETLLILLALSLGIPASLISSSGQLGLFAFTFLPCGFLQAARMGAAKSISRFMLVIGGLYLLIALACLLPHGGAFLLIPAWVMLHIIRSCSAAMNFPIQKNIATEKELPVMLSRNLIVGMITGLGSSLLIMYLLTFFQHPQKNLLPILFCLAFQLHFLCSLNICRIVEPASLKRMANHKVLKQALIAWRLPHLRHQIYVGSAMNLWIAMVPSVNILTMKEGFHFSDASILFLGIVQTLSSIIASYLYKKTVLHFGPAKVLTAICPLIWLLFLYWILIPGEISLWAALPPFILTGLIHITISTGLGNHFTNTVDNVYQIGGTFWIFVVTGGQVGLIGMVLNPMIFNLIKYFGIPDGMETFRTFYIITAILFAALIAAPLSLVRRKQTEQ